MNCPPPPPHQRKAELFVALSKIYAELAELEGGARGGLETANDVAPLPSPPPRPQRPVRRGPRFPSAAKIAALQISDTDRKAAEKAARAGGMLPATATPRTR